MEKFYMHWPWTLDVLFLSHGIIPVLWKYKADIKPSAAETWEDFKVTHSKTFHAQPLEF